MKIVIVGGVAGGATAAARLRRLDESAEILLLERGEFVSFANCGLPYYIGREIQNRDALFVSDIASIEGKYNVQIRNFSEVTAIDREKKTVTVRRVKSGEEYEESYDKLLLSTGSHPFIPDMEGISAPDVFTLWNIPDTDRIDAFIEREHPRRALVVGGGFIGLEMAENLVSRGLAVTVAEFADQVMPPLDPDMAKLVQDHLITQGVDLQLKKGLSAIRENGRRAVLTDGTEVETDMILLSIGVRPNSELAKAAGLELNARGGIVTDELMRTSDPDIFAIGDVSEVENPIDGSRGMVPLAGPANRQGRAVAANLLGRTPEPYAGTIGTSVAKIFDLTVAGTGMNEKQLSRKGMRRWQDYGVSLIHPLSHAGYYPGAVPMTLKLLFSMPEGKVLGAQIVGYDGVDKRIDTIATAIHFHGTVVDLTQMELAYAPPYSSAKDPVNMAGYAAQNVLDGLTEPITWDELEQQEGDCQILDIREKPETAMGMAEGAVNIPLTQLRDRLGELDPGRQYFVYCAVGLRGYLAERVLKQRGYQARNILGGYRTWGDLHRSPEPGSPAGSRGPVEQEKLVREAKKEEKKEVQTLRLDACGLSCPGPIVQVSRKMAQMREGDLLEVRATDPGFARDIRSWCSNTGNTLVKSGEKKGIFLARIRKGQESLPDPVMVRGASPSPKEKTMIVFDGDLDKAIASFIIATGAAAMGNRVNMFFTFWGLNILRRPERVPVRKDFIGRMFGAMMPRGSRRLGLSQMNFFGLGAKMMRAVMKKKGITSLEDLIRSAQEAGVRMTACQMSMGVMGITREELIDGVEIGGVASMLDDSDRSNMNLFI